MHFPVIHIHQEEQAFEEVQLRLVRLALQILVCEESHCAANKDEGIYADAEAACVALGGGRGRG